MINHLSNGSIKGLHSNIDIYYLLHLLFYDKTRVLPDFIDDNSKRVIQGAQYNYNVGF